MQTDTSLNYKIGGRKLVLGGKKNAAFSPYCCYWADNSVRNTLGLVQNFKKSNFFPSLIL